ncbi:somatoliberin isoform X1 [Ranitomeya variabilis]|uniref:somatoliberin isoform X1 n=2 Tax=Ranitomeya variabilis TaxID=490064 RepID=UPI004057B41E
MVMHRFLYLVLLQFGFYVHCYLMHPNYSYEQTSKSSRNVNLPVLKRSPMQDWSLNEAQGFVRGLSEKRMERHVDAIFTNTYRKFLGQISARRYLQNMMGKRLGQDDLGALYPTDSEIGQRTLRDTLASVLTSLKKPEWGADEPQPL